MIVGGQGPHQIGILGGYTLFHYVCSSGNVEIYEYIVRRIVQVHGDLSRAILDSENHTKESPLHWAVLKNNYRIVKRLIAEHRKIAEIRPQN